MTIIKSYSLLHFDEETSAAHTVDRPLHPPEVAPQEKEKEKIKINKAKMLTF